MRKLIIGFVLLSFNHFLFAQLNPGQIGSDQTIPYRSAPAALTFTTPPSGGTLPYRYKWQRSNNGGLSFSNIEGAASTRDIYYPPILGKTALFRCKVIDATPSVLYTNMVTINVLASFNAGTIGNAQTICYSTLPNPLIELQPATGGGGSYTYQWQNSTDGLTWSNIQGATSLGFTPNALIANTWYRRMVTDITASTVNSNSVRITIFPLVSSGQLHDNIIIDENTSTNFNVTISGGTSPFTVNYTRNGATQPTINNYVSGTNISTGVLAAGVYTYALTSTADANGCLAQSLGTNITVTATVNGNLAPGSIGSAQIICHNTTPTPLTQITAPTGGTGVYTFQWQSSPDNSNWADVVGATNFDYSPPALSASTYYRRTVTSGTYLPVYSNYVLITVSTQITLVQLHDNITIENNTSTNFNIVVSGGISPYTVNYTRNGVAQPTINNYVSGTNISTGTLTTGVYTYALTSVTDADGCAAQSLGTTIIVTVTDSYTPVATLFSTEVPISYSSDSRYELGTEFQTLSNGFITKARLFSHINEGGDHIVRLWRFNGSAYGLIAGPYTWNFTTGIQGWREFELPLPVEVTANTRYIISITNSSDLNYVKSENFSSVTINEYVRYLRGLYTANLGSVPTYEYYASCYFRDIVFAISGANGGLTPGSIGNPQTICYNTAPATLTQLYAPTGGTGEYTFQWQTSPNNSIWTNIDGATLSDYSPPFLTASTYYRRTVTSGSYASVNSSPVLITVSPLITLAQLHDDITIYNNTSTNFNVVISGGTSPYTINYTRNGVAQPTINNYVSGTNISTGILPLGTYTYALTAVTGTYGCVAQSLGTNITITVTDDQGTIREINKALVIVNSASSYYTDYVYFIAPYLDNFGIPYDVCNISTTALPEFSGYAILIFGHNNVYETAYPISQIETAVAGGVGLFSFDPHLFDFPSGFNSLITQRTVNSNLINISNYTHYITSYHAPDTYSPTNNVVNLLRYITVVQNSNLVNGTDLASLSADGQTVPLLQVTNYGDGKVIRWNGYDWVLPNILGPVYGMDDLIWRGIVWSARKPFIMQGMPPFITMRVDDGRGTGSELTNNFEWIRICNEYRIIPWCGTFNNEIPSGYIPALRTLLDNDLATASPHAFSSDDFIYFNHNNLGSFDAAAKTLEARAFYVQHGLKISKFLVPHWYEISSDALSEVHNMGIEFIGIHMLPDNHYGVSWINNGPFRENRYGYSSEQIPVYYADANTFNGISFFNCLSEIRDDGGYEWYPTNDPSTTSARGIRHLRRALNSMVLPTLFTHEYYFGGISITNFREIISTITSSIAAYNPEYTSMDYALQYIRAKDNIKITNVVETPLNVEIHYSGTNDMETKCYLFTGQGDQITYRFIDLPQINGSSTVSVLK
jgi:hypothetical protein